jgi:hypothetical protein
MRPRALQFGQLSSANCEAECSAALQSRYTMQASKLDPVKTPFLDESQQDRILSTLHVQSAQYLKAKFQQDRVYYDPDLHAPPSSGGKHRMIRCIRSCLASTKPTHFRFHLSITFAKLQTMHLDLSSRSRRRSDELFITMIWPSGCCLF